MAVIQDYLRPDVLVWLQLSPRCIRLYFICSSLTGLELLRDLLESGKLKVMLEDMLILLLAGVEFGPVLVKRINFPEYWKYVDYFMNTAGMYTKLFKLE